MSILSIEHLGKVYGPGDTAVRALEDVSFTVEVGEFVAIGRALMNAPAVILADEPTGNLDTRNSAQVMQLLRDSNARFKQTLVVITHDEDIALMADRVIAIEDGRIVRDTSRPQP